MHKQKWEKENPVGEQCEKYWQSPTAECISKIYTKQERIVILFVLGTCFNIAKTNQICKKQ